MTSVCSARGIKATGVLTWGITLLAVGVVWPAPAEVGASQALKGKAAVGKYNVHDGLKIVAAGHQAQDVRAAAGELLRTLAGPGVPDQIRKGVEERKWAAEGEAIADALGFLTAFNLDK